MRTRPLSIAALLVAAAGLTACQAPAGSTDGCGPLLQPGAATSQVSVEQAEGAPTVEFEIPLVSDGDQAQVLGGEGERASEGDIVDADYVVYSGKTGALISSSYEASAEGQPPATPLRLTAGGESVLADAVACGAPGASIVVTTTISSLFGPTAESPELDITPADTAVVVPVGATVVMTVTGADVIHAWAMPAFGVKQDAVPGRLAQLWFAAEKEGVYFGQCSELCGKDHAYMPITVKVVSEEDYEAWLDRAIARHGGTPRNTDLARAD